MKERYEINIGTDYISILDNNKDEDEDIEEIIGNQIKQLKELR